VALGIILATFLAARAGESHWLVITGPLVLALALVCSDVLDSRLQGPFSPPSRAALILGTSVPLGSWLVSLRDPTLLKWFLPSIGIAAWLALFLRPESRRKPCWGI
jgi:hypothetical protein